MNSFLFAIKVIFKQVPWLDRRAKRQRDVETVKGFEQALNEEKRSEHSFARKVVFTPSTHKKPPGRGNFPAETKLAAETINPSSWEGDGGGSDAKP